MKQRKSIVITVVVIAALAVGLLLLPKILNSSKRTDDTVTNDTGTGETQMDLASLAEDEESWAQEREQAQSLAEEKQAEVPTIAGGNFWIVLNPESSFTLNEEVSGWHGKLTWKVTDVALVGCLPDYPSAKYTQSNDLYFLNEEGGLAIERIDYTRICADNNGNISQEPAEADLAILLVEIEVSSGLSYEFDFEYPLRVTWFEEKEGRLCRTFTCGMSKGEGIDLYAAWGGEGMPFYISVADRNGAEEDPNHFLFYKLQPGETLRYQAAFLVDRNTLDITWLNGVKNINNYLYYDVKPSFLPVGQLLTAGGETE